MPAGGYKLASSALRLGRGLGTGPRQAVTWEESSRAAAGHTLSGRRAARWLLAALSRGGEWLAGKKSAMCNVSHVPSVSRSVSVVRADRKVWAAGR